MSDLPTVPEEPLPCPWCGSNTRVADVIKGFSFAVQCDDWESPGAGRVGSPRDTFPVEVGK